MMNAPVLTPWLTEQSDVDLVARILGLSDSPLPSLLLHQQGGLRGIAAMSPQMLCQFPGIGPRRALRLLAALEAGRRALRASSPLPLVHTPEQAHALLYPELAGRRQEAFYAMYLNRRRRLLGLACLTVGNDAHTIVDPRQVFKAALEHDAAAVIVAHNHPSGDPEPSLQDQQVTRRLAQAGQLLNIDLIDHLVLGGDRYVSLAARGMVPASGPNPSMVFADLVAVPGRDLDYDVR